MKSRKFPKRLLLLLRHRSRKGQAQCSRSCHRRHGLHGGHRRHRHGHLRGWPLLLQLCQAMAYLGAGSRWVFWGNGRFSHVFWGKKQLCFAWWLLESRDGWFFSLWVSPGFCWWILSVGGWGKRPVDLHHGTYNQDISWCFDHAYPLVNVYRTMENQHL